MLSGALALLTVALGAEPINVLPVEQFVELVYIDSGEPLKNRDVSFCLLIYSST